ncbi:hypothetical protein BU17DRAFT_67681 [Hysterangium stoloniferum]|nr:hypothetical protein BU17DRAFT_67681 [Hysterangium stoloniferum]
MIAPTTPPAPSVPLPRIYEDDSGRCWEEYMPPRYIPLPPIHEDDSGRCRAEYIPPPPMPFRYIPLPPIHEDDSGRCRAEYIPPPPMPFRYIPLPPIHEDDSGRCRAEYIPPPPMPFRYIPLPPIHEDDSGRCRAEYIPPPPFPFRYIPLPPIGEDKSVRSSILTSCHHREQANYHAYLPKLRLAGHIPLPPLPPDRDRSGAVVYETPVDVRYSAVVSHKYPIEGRALRPSEGLPRARATLPSRFISDRSQVTEPVFLANGRRRTDGSDNALGTQRYPPGITGTLGNGLAGGETSAVMFALSFKIQLPTFSPTTSAKHVVWTQIVNRVFTLVYKSLLQREDRNLLRMLVTIDGKQHNALTPRHHHANFAKRHGCVTHP